MTEPLVLRAAAEELAAPFPALLAGAEHLAATVLLGAHGRRRAGTGDDFWQYRPVQHGDAARMIDWRRSAMADTEFVREREWQIAQSVILWVDYAASMNFASATHQSKAARARLLALAVSILLLRGGERVGFTGFELPPRAGEHQIERLATALSISGDGADFGVPEARGMLPHSRALFISDFLGDPRPVEDALRKAADRGVGGALLMVLDPEEEAFPYDGRTIFQSMGGGVLHETLKAGELKDRYLDRLAERKDLLAGWARAAGWQFSVHHTDSSAQPALLWLYGALERHH
ncbi:MAG: DUF58 domain-containing protein [Pseudomonadota bacterium]